MNAQISPMKPRASLGDIPEEVDGDVQVFLQDDGKVGILIRQHDKRWNHVRVAAVSFTLKINVMFCQGTVCDSQGEG